MRSRSRRDFLVTSLALGSGALALGAGRSMAQATAPATVPAPVAGTKIRWGMVTYQWGADWDLPTLIANLEATKTYGVELRTTHAHGVEPSLSAAERAEVKKRFDDSPVVCLGPGSADEYHHPDPAGLLEVSSRVDDRIAALNRQREAFETLVTNAKQAVKG